VRPPELRKVLDDFAATGSVSSAAVIEAALLDASDGELLAELRRRRSLRGQLGVVLAFVGDPMRAPLVHPVDSNERRAAAASLARDLRLWQPDHHPLVSIAADLVEAMWGGEQP